MRKKKKKKAAGPLSVASMLREGQTMGVSTQRSSPIVVVPTTPLCPADAGGGGGSGLTDPLLSLIGSTNDHALIQAVSAVDFDIDLESLLDVSEGSLGSQPAAEVPLFHPGAIDYPRPPNAGGALQLKPHPGQTQLLRPPSAHGCVPLPEGLPPGLEHSIGRLAAAAKTSEGESKLKFFTPDINSILRDIELRCREHGGQLRSRVYTHLSSFLPCSRDTLLRREEAPPDADDPLHKLKDAVGRAMPEQVALFQEKCQVYEQIRAAKATEEENGQEDNVEEKGGKRGGPKKLFKWNDEIRQCLFQVLRLKLQQCKTQKGSQELEEYLKTVLDNEVKPLWPKGWMQSRVLIRESRNVFNLLTSSPAKRSRLDRKPPSVVVRSDVCRAPPMKGLPEGAIAASTSLDAASLRPVEVKPAKPPTDEPVVVAATAPTPSLLDLLADQALAREQPLPFSQELLAAAVSNYQRSMQRWSVSSPPLPPPPPQSSPVGFPLSAASPGGFPQVAHLARRQMTPDEADVTLQ
ncbi:ubinuclein-1-like [Antennarius striatus]|uniref:ubinuclein-1-like n=1 Tax=Antennarius striatus TaxID=241820 RepID=UPI0035B3F051